MEMVGKWNAMAQMYFAVFFFFFFSGDCFFLFAGFAFAVFLGSLLLAIFGVCSFFFFFRMDLLVPDIGWLTFGR